MALEPRPTAQIKQYDYLLKFLLVGDSDVGKQEILSGLEDGSSESPFCSGSAYKTTTILLDGKRVKLQLWDTSGQGRFCTIIRSYSRGAQGILLVYDITNKWSFDGIDRWLKEVEELANALVVLSSTAEDEEIEHAPGVPKVLVGNRLHLAFKRQVGASQAETYALKNHMAFFEVSPLCDFNIRESFSELSRMALHRNGMERLWRSNKGRDSQLLLMEVGQDGGSELSGDKRLMVAMGSLVPNLPVLCLQELCCRAIVARTTVYGIDQLPLPTSIKSHLKSYAMTNTSNQHRYVLNHISNRGSVGGRLAQHKKLRFVGGVSSTGMMSPSPSSGSPTGVDSSRTSCTGRNSCVMS
uniref:SOCS box domain-containing protein n=1 Tax=Timema douglasi TaxID=61478 RepID=A0A7R8VHY3_TIMDO|nr:unnamed protein product [Timema douglasi]